VEGAGIGGVQGAGVQVAFRRTRIEFLSSLLKLFNASI